jgi:hypothetical protein
MAANDKSEPFGRASSGHLPSTELVARLVAEAYNRFKSNREGSFLKNWEWVCSSRKPRSNDRVCPEAEGESVARSGQESLAQGLPWEIPPRALALKGPRSARIGSELLNRIVCAFSSPFSFRAKRRWHSAWFCQSLPKNKILSIQKCSSKSKRS